MTTCPGCGKVVYFAERQTREGKDWHGKCLQVFLKEQGKGAKGASPFHSFTDARREPPPTTTAGTVTSAPAGTIAGAGAKFCGNCGKAKALGDKFCASCGSQA